LAGHARPTAESGLAEFGAGPQVGIVSSSRGVRHQKPTRAASCACMHVGTSAKVVSAALGVNDRDEVA
jgi:hypothetical protein